MTFVNLVESAEQIDDRGFPGTGMPNKRDLFTRFHFERDIPQNVVIIVIGKPDVPKFNLTFQRLGTIFRDGRSDSRLCIKQLEDAFGRCHGVLEDGIFFAEFSDGPEEAFRVTDKC